jgi:nucleotide-binding universal stress UspA family protein
VEGGFYDSGSEERDKRELEKYQQILQDGIRQLGEAGFKAHGEVVVGESVDEIAKYARKINSDLIVVGHRHLDSWAARWWRGSTARSLVEHSPCSVLVVVSR